MFELEQAALVADAERPVRAEPARRLPSRPRDTGRSRADRPPRLPGDAENQERDRKPDQRVAHVGAEGDHAGARDDAEADEAVDACVVPVGDEGRAAERLAAAEP